jgi:hypothetical protein
MNEYDLLTAICMGIGLSAAAGFRVFLPPFLLSLLMKASMVDINLEGTEYEFFASDISILLLGIASISEFLAFYVPWVDNLLDTIASPAAIIAGGTMTLIVLEGNTDPALQWGLAIIAGGGVSGVIQGTTVVTRAASTFMTAGLGNPVVATGENIATIVLTILALLLPVLAAIVVFYLIFMAVKKYSDRKNKSKPSS